ncbi:MAG: hypothetical protein Q9220_001120 [cf. Caloplaca sp. 1 TL-2023]
MKRFILICLILSVLSHICGGLFLLESPEYQDLTVLDIIQKLGGMKPHDAIIACGIVAGTNIFGTGCLMVWYSLFYYMTFSPTSSSKKADEDRAATLKDIIDLKNDLLEDEDSDEEESDEEESDETPTGCTTNGCGKTGCPECQSPPPLVCGGGCFILGKPRGETSRDNFKASNHTFTLLGSQIHDKHTGSDHQREMNAPVMAPNVKSSTDTYYGDSTNQEYNTRMNVAPPESGRTSPLINWAFIVRLALISQIPICFFHFCFLGLALFWLYQNSYFCTLQNGMILANIPAIPVGPKDSWMLYDLFFSYDAIVARIFLTVVFMAGISLVYLVAPGLFPWLQKVDRNRQAILKHDVAALKHDVTAWKHDVALKDNAAVKRRTRSGIQKAMLSAPGIKKEL